MSTSFALDWITRQVGGSKQEATPGESTEIAARFSTLWPLLQAASVLPGRFDVNLLAGILAMDGAKLKPLLINATHHDGLTLAVDNSFSVPQKIRVAAYAAIPVQAKRALHRRAAEMMGLRNPATSEDAASVAHQFEKAEDIQKAFDWWMAAATGAIEDGVPACAIQYLERALALPLTEGASQTAENKLAPLRLLGPLLAQLKGSGFNDVAAVYAHCLEIAEGLTGAASAIEFDVLWGLNACILVHGRIETAGEMSQRLLAAGRAAGNETHVLLATRLHGMAALLSGELDAALVDFRTVKAIGESADYTHLRFTHASDQSAIARAHQAWAEAIAGDIDASAHSHNVALDHAEQLQHPHTSAHVMSVLAARAQTLGLRGIAAPLAHAALTIARQQGFAYWEAWAEIILAWNEGLRGIATSGARIDRAILAYRDTGAGQALPYAHHLRAGVAIAAGDFQTARAAADAGLAIADAYGVILFQPALLLDKAEATADPADQHALLTEAATIARIQGANLYVHRAAALRERANARFTHAVTPWQHGTQPGRSEVSSFHEASG